MNETKPFKLHKTHKILCIIVCFVIVFSLTCISSFAITSVFNVRSTPLNSTQYSFFDDGEILSFPCAFTIDVDGVDHTVTSLDVAMGYIIGDQQQYIFYFPMTLDGETYNVPWFGYIENADGSFQIANLSSPIPRSLNGYIDIPDNMKSFFHNVLEFTDEYEGNPWIDILNGVMEALDVKIFGTFSYLDIISTLAGACLCIWLLKMLAGG